jgi:rhamnosyltransferase
MVRVAIICPTYNAGEFWPEWIKSVKIQMLYNYEVLVLDSGSTDNTINLAKDAGFKVIEFPNHEFNHGQTRNFGADYMGNSYDFLVYLTQDAILSDQDSLVKIIKPFEDEAVGAVCGRQLPHKWANPIESHARLFNYPAHSLKKDKSDIGSLGIKTAYMSNSFAAYRYKAFIECGGFPADTIFAEDMSLAAKMIIAGWKTYYSSEARVFHSHSYTFMQEFRRYFDVGVFYCRENWIAENFGNAGGEGLKFVKSELFFLIRHGKFSLIPSAIMRTGLKFIAFKLGGFEKLLSTSLKRKLSMNKNYWK